MRIVNKNNEPTVRLDKVECGSCFKYLTKGHILIKLNDQGYVNLETGLYSIHGTPSSCSVIRFDGIISVWPAT